jgi:hypothetical protein
MSKKNGAVIILLNSRCDKRVQFGRINYSAKLIIINLETINNFRVHNKPSMKNIFVFACAILLCISCNTNPQKNNNSNIADAKDTTAYPYKATYSSDLSMQSNPEIAKKVLTVWKMYENKQMDSMQSYYADTVTYDDANGNHFHGASAGLLALAKKEMEKLDSLRFDISSWESIHSNDKNEDWVNIWCAERSYPKNGMPDTTLMYEQWKVKDGKVYYFNQYRAKLPK